MTRIICFDDHRTFSEDVRKRFSDQTKYAVTSYHSREEFIRDCTGETDKNDCKVAIIGVPDAREQFVLIGEIAAGIKKTNPETGLILLVSEDRMDDIKKVIRFNIDAYVPKNTNSILRIHNTVKRLISEKNIGIFKRRRNLALLVLLVFLLLSAMALIYFYIRLPQYF
jgi:DNA-binding NarL/FixJ family response regulator